MVGTMTDIIVMLLQTTIYNPGYGRKEVFYEPS